MTTTNDTPQLSHASESYPPGGATPEPPAPTHATRATPYAPEPRLQDPRAKSPVLACILSVVPGLGQIYVGYYVRGFVHAIVIALLLTIGISLDSVGGTNLIPLIPLFMIFFWLYNIIDAGRKAALYNQALAGGAPIDLPSDFAMPSFRGSIGAGIALVFGGFVLLMHTRFGLTLDWIEEWWPLAPIGLGVYLVFKAMQDRASESD